MTNSSPKGTKAKTGKKAKKPLSAAEKAERKIKQGHIRSARSVFTNMGFVRAPEIAGKNLTYKLQGGEIDDAFVYENVVVLAEYTTSKSANVSDHIKHKKIFYSKIAADEGAFLQFLRDEFPEFEDRLAKQYHHDQLLLRIVYCSLNDVDDSTKLVVDEVAYLDFPILKYFEKLSRAIKHSCQSEFFHFIALAPNEVGEGGVINGTGSHKTYDGLILPEAASGFPAGYKVVSFYADADALLKRAFVLRRNGWRSSMSAYQRMLIPSKVEAIRSNLLQPVDGGQGHVAINNIIATLPDDVQPVDKNNKSVEISTLKRNEPVRITLPLRANSIGLIDGQHRLFSYYQSADEKPRIKQLRSQQNLLVTGIIYPASIKQGSIAAQRFEAGLFLSINSNQSAASAPLRQEIEVLLDPFSATAISKQVMEKLGSTSPLVGHVERYFFDKGKLKTSSIVSFGLKPLLKLGGSDSIFSIFKHQDKADLAKGTSDAARTAYIAEAVAIINQFLSAVKANVEPERWTADRAVKGRALSVTHINTYLITIRILIQNGKPLSFPSFRDKLKNIQSFIDKNQFASSQYNSLAQAIYNKFFS